MITMITGMPGDGKTLFAVSRIVKSLITSDCFIVTNIRMVPGELHELVSREMERLLNRKRDKSWRWNLDKRIKFITDEESREFYRYRSGDLELAHSPDWLLEDEDTGRKRLPKYKHDREMLSIFTGIKSRPRGKLPVHYYIDEVHDIFPSREWDKVGRGMLFYASKHRHLHDEIFLITQQIDQVEKQLRNLTSETVVVRNRNRRSVGIFKARAGFDVKHFYGIPTGNAKPFDVSSMYLDVAGVAKCYKTTGALGVHDSPEEIKNKGKLPFWMIPVAAVVVLVLIVAGFVCVPMLGGLVSGRLMKGSGKAVAAVVDQPPSSIAAPTSGGKSLLTAAAPIDLTRTAAAPRVSNPVIQQKPVTVDGWAVLKNRVTVKLSDGRVLTEGDKSLQAIDRNGVTVDGVKLYMSPHTSRPPEVKKDSPREEGVGVQVTTADTQPSDGDSRPDGARGSAAVAMRQRSEGARPNGGQTSKGSPPPPLQSNPATGQQIPIQGTYSTEGPKSKAKAH